MSTGSVAIVDIGSNSIKILVAERREDETIGALFSRTIDARISAGISSKHPRLSEESMARGLDAIQQLLAEANRFAPTRTVLVATSAVRDAENGVDFRELVRTGTGQVVRILSGREEAALIGRGLTCDPALSAVSNFYVFDLGGGSLECLAFRDRIMNQAVSLQLGCVRLTEMLVPDAAKSISQETIALIQSHTRNELAKAGFDFGLPGDAMAVGTGGTITTTRAMLAARAGRSLEQTPSRVELTGFRQVLGELSALPLTGRKQVAGLPPARADVFPTALATLVAVAEMGNFSAYQHSFYNLRYGLAAEVLGSI